MKVTPLDIRRKEFRRSVRGYLDEDVDVFLDAVADECERLTKMNTDLQARVQGLEEQVSSHSDIREALEKTLVAAQLQSEEIRSKAQKESQSMLREAEAKAKTVVDEFYAKTQAVQRTLMQLKLLEEDFRFKFKALLEGYLKLLAEGPLVFSTLSSEARAVEPGAPEASSPVVPAGSAVGAPEKDDNPTFETAEVASVAGNSGRSAPPPAAPNRPPHIPEPGQAGKTTQAPDDDRTVETSPASVKAKASKRPRPGEEPPGEQSEGGVFFGRPAVDGDDPFPEIGGERAKPRDFEW